MNEIKSCPFCNWPASLFDTQEAPYWVECTDCFAQGAPEDSREEAIASWNQRPTPDQPMTTTPPRYRARNGGQ